MWFLGLFSLVPALVVMGVMDRWVRGEVSADNRFTGRLMLMTCGLFLGLGYYSANGYADVYVYRTLPLYVLSDAARRRKPSAECDIVSGLRLFGCLFQRTCRHFGALCW